MNYLRAMENMQNFETVGTKSFLHILLGFGIYASSQVLCKQDTADDLHTHTHTHTHTHRCQNIKFILLTKEKASVKRTASPGWMHKIGCSELVH